MANNKGIQEEITNLITDRINQELEEQIIEARRIISELETIDSVAAFSQVQDQIQKSHKTFRLLNALSRVAAILFIPLLMVTSWNFYHPIHSMPVQQYSMQEITSPPGIRSQVVLPDGSKVWLNAESTIQFSVPFHKESRNINLLGEAFFDVTKNAEQPFIVQSGKVKVTVLGTRFNFKAFALDPTIEVILEEGKIALNRTGKVGENETILKPGDRFIYKKKSNVATIKNENISKYIAWHDGKLIFNNTPIAEVAQMLSRWYGIEVIVTDPGIMNYRFTTTFENESLFQVTELLGLSSPIQFKYIPARLGKENQTQCRSKVIINKKLKN